MKIDKFEDMGLKAEILKALSNLGFENPSEVQKEVIPELLNKKDYKTIKLFAVIRIKKMSQFM